MKKYAPLENYCKILDRMLKNTSANRSILTKLHNSARKEGNKNLSHLFLKIYSKSWTSYTRAEFLNVLTCQFFVLRLQLLSRPTQHLNFYSLFSFNSSQRKQATFSTTQMPIGYLSTNVQCNCAEYTL